MKDHGVNSSDLERTRALSQKLSSRLTAKKVRGGFVGASALDPPYLPLRKRESTMASEQISKGPVPPPPSKEVVKPPPFFDGWEPLIKWCAERFDAEAGFVVNTQGFVIATTGQAAHDGFEGMGAELCYGMEQLERVDPSAGGLLWVDLEFGRRRIVCLRAAPKGEDPMLLGFVGVNDAYIEDRSEIEELVIDSMPALT